MTSCGWCHWLVLVLTTLSVCDVIEITKAAFLSDTLYISNSSHILFVNSADLRQNTSVTPTYTAQDGGRVILSLSYSLPDNLLFWSEFYAIYSASTDNQGRIVNKTKIVTTKTKDIRGLAVDWISKHIYWTDFNGGTLEVSDFYGTLQRVLLIDLNQPQAVCADPINQWLFWNEQGSEQIMRSRLDGSSRVVFVSNQSSNQMSLNNGKLHWVNFNDKTLRSVSVNDASHVQSVPLIGPGVNHVLGLATNDNTAYVTYWSRDYQLFTVTANLNDASSVSTVVGGAPQRLTSFPVLSAIYVSNQVQPSGNNPCSSSICQPGQLCLPVGGFYRCSCPTYGAQSLNSATGECQRPRHILLYTLADSGFIGFYDPTAEKNGDFYFIARSARPVAVTYDPDSQWVYWSDVQTRTIHRCKLDGSFSAAFIDRSKGYVVGIVDGMAVDYVGRRLIYTNLDEHVIGDLTYSWHKVESASIQWPLNVKTIVSEICDKPRAIVVDVKNAVLYYTDWGSKASVVKSNLDGSNQTVIRTGLFNPNGLVLQGNTLYVADSNYKTRTFSLGQSMDGSVYRMDVDGNNWVNVLSNNSTSPGIKTPFGLASNGADILYVSDWDSTAISAYDISTNEPSPTVLVNGSSPMALYYTPVSLPARPAARPGSCSTCRDICLPRNSRSSKCACNSYKARSLKTDGKQCAVPNEYLLVSDIDGVKMISLENPNDKSIYVASVGRSRKTNFVGFTFDPCSNTAYYSDLFSKDIYALNVANATSRVFYSVNHQIDGLAVDNGTLYWTDFRIGLIASIAVNYAPGDSHNTLLTGLSNPRAVKVHQSFIYWTEWGLNPRVARMPVSGPFVAETLVSAGLRWPNGLFLSGDRMFVADGHPVQRSLINCSLDGSRCEQIASVNNENVKHMFGIHVTNDILYYSDWNTTTIGVLALSGRGLNQTLQPLATGFIRPSQFHFITSPSTPGIDNSNCASSESCSWPAGTCLQLIGSQQCICNENYTSDGLGCVPVQSARCGQYNVGETFTPPNKPCLTCQCLANHLFADPENDGATCEVIQCPPTDCDSPTTPTGQCCPVCPPCSGITIKNCPTIPVNVSLPPERFAKAFYEYSPTHKDCRGLTRHVVSVTDPLNNLFGVGTYAIVTTVSASQPYDKAQCRFTLNVIDETVPTIRCPDTVRIYTDNSSVNIATAVKWSTPEVYDNAGVPAVVSDIAWASTFIEGSTTVTYTATDNAKNVARCSFEVIATRLVQPTIGAVCRIPRLERGQLNCRVRGGSLECETICDQGFSKSSKAIPDKLICDDGKWDKVIPDNFESFGCLRVVAGTIQGSIGILASASCSLKLDLSYTNFRLKAEIETVSKPKSQFALRYDVNSSCSASGDVPSEVVHIAVVVSGDYTDEADKTKLELDINTILKDISNDLRNENLEVVLRNDSRIWSVPTLVVKNADVTEDGCPLGSYSEKDIGCVYCPAGSYQSGPKCASCPKGTYSDQEGGTKCTPCPDDRSTTIVEFGASFKEQCVPTKVEIPDPASNYVLIIVALSSVIVLMIIAIIIALVICSRKRRRPAYIITADTEPSSARGCAPSSSSKHFNKSYDKSADATDEYDEIPANMVATTSSGAYANENKYEELPPQQSRNTFGASGDTSYETLRK